MRNQLNPKRIRNGIFIVVVLGFIAASLIAVFTIDKNTLRALGTINPLFLGYAVLAVVITWLFSALPFLVLTRVIKTPINFRESLQVYLGGSFIGFITPFASGLLPTQIYILTVKGLSPGQATAIASARATISSWMFGAIALLMFVAFRTTLPGSSNDVLIGIMGLAVAWSLMVLFFIKQPQKAKIFITRVFRIKFLSSRLGQSRTEKLLDRIHGEISYLSSNLKDVFSFRNSASLVFVFLIEVIAWFALFSVLPLILFGFGYVENTPEIIFRLFILFTIAPISPTPGGSGVIELAFTGFLVSLVPRAIIGLVVLLWRALTYYLTLIVSGIVLLRFASTIKTDESQEGVES